MLLVLSVVIFWFDRGFFVWVFCINGGVIKFDKFNFVLIVCCREFEFFVGLLFVLLNLNLLFVVLLVLKFELLFLFLWLMW